MNAVEEIQAAIDTLNTMRAVSDSGAWTVAGIHPDCSIEGDVNFIAGDMYDYDAELIVTLHRTIDAQIALLSHTLDIRAKYVVTGIEQMWIDAVERAGDLALARAINGATS